MAQFVEVVRPETADLQVVLARFYKDLNAASGLDGTDLRKAYEGLEDVLSGLRERFGDFHPDIEVAERQFDEERLESIGNGKI